MEKWEKVALAKGALLCLVERCLVVKWVLVVRLE